MYMQVNPELADTLANHANIDDLLDDFTQFDELARQWRLFAHNDNFYLYCADMIDTDDLVNLLAKPFDDSIYQ